MDKRLYVELPPFTGRNVPITEIEKQSEKMLITFVLGYSREF